MVFLFICGQFHFMPLRTSGKGGNIGIKGNIPNSPGHKKNRSEPVSDAFLFTHLMF
jgi:hypothetical protein